MTAALHAQLLGFCLIVGLAWFAYAYLYKQTRLAAFREELFSIRDGLFDYMLRNDLSFDMPAYGKLRQSINGAILAADRLNLSILKIYGRWMDRMDEPCPVLRAIQQIEDTDVRVHFERVYYDLGMRGLRYVAYEGPISFSYFVALVFKAALNSASEPGQIPDHVREGERVRSREIVELAASYQRHREYSAGPTPQAA